MKTECFIRKLQADDIMACVLLFEEAVNFAEGYTSEQKGVWAPKNMSYKDVRWQTLLDHIAFVALLDDQIVGFADMEFNGYLDRLYVHRNFQRRGIAAALIRQLEICAKELALIEMTTEASITAKPFFETIGYKICQEQQKNVRGVILTNFVMKKTL